MSRWGPVTVETIRGRPIRVMGRTITPVARSISATRHGGTIGKTQVEGEAWSMLLTRPLAIVEERHGEARVLGIPDVTRRILASMTLVAALFPLLSLVLVRVNQWMRGK